ncbi:hypothetical protein BT63DRAFT_468530 [Microthyrium microscopicum]|uniref:Alpha-galactosidase A n=1 Tax=Microthyrium microscopicum TaxID=703497 RepID=A0A6A6UEN4_9PEZI|nr:hypothetical protein BT63DRAFT_468530 [Microthyrium microscopicum]
MLLFMKLGDLLGYEVLEEGKLYVKNVTTAPGILPKDHRTFAPILIPLLPEFPTGHWNSAHICKAETNNELVFSRITYKLTNLKRLRQNIHKVSHPSFSQPILVKFAEFSWQIPQVECETTAYQWIDGSGIGPKFLGHVTEAGRTIGFVTEFVEDARTATLQDLEQCQGILTKLHAMDLKHGDINKHNFLIYPEGVLLVDFETTRSCNKQEELEEEYRKLEASLGDLSHRGGVGPRIVGLPI